MKEKKPQNTRPNDKTNEPRQTARNNNKKNSPEKEKARTPNRLKLVVGDPWPEASKGTENLRGGILIGLVLLTSALLLALAGYAFINKDDRMILEILGFVKMFLSGVGGWVIGRSQK